MGGHASWGERLIEVGPGAGGRGVVAGTILVRISRLGYLFIPGRDVRTSGIPHVGMAWTNMEDERDNCDSTSLHSSCLWTP